MLRILLIAPTCDGTDVGEAWVAHQWASRLAERHQVTLLTYYKSGRTPARQQLRGLEVIEWSEPPLLSRFERLNSLLKPGYLVFHRRARRWIRRTLDQGREFDIAHQPVPVAMRYPSPAVGLGIPLVIGPVGGGLAEPAGFDLSGDTSPWYVKLRGFDAPRLRYDPWLRRTYARADCVLGIAPYSGEKLRDVSVRRFECMSETALERLPAPIPRGAHGGPLRLLFVGRVIKTKGVRYAVQALATEQARRAELDVVGTGPDLVFCQELADKLGVSDRVRFHGNLERHDVSDFYRTADVFVFPSYREPGGNVVFEAMGHGLPLVVCDRGGPGASTDDTCAIRLPVTTESALVLGVADAIGILETDPDLRLAMGAAARVRVAATGLWEHRIARFETLAAELLSEREETQ